MGRAGKIQRAIADEVKRMVIERPAEQGLDRANWTPTRTSLTTWRRHAGRTANQSVTSGW